MRKQRLEEGDLVLIDETFINPSDEIKKFIGKRCRIIKLTKAGLINIHIDGDVRKRISVPEYCLNRIY